MTYADLDFKLWSTSDTRFNTSKRLILWKQFIQVSLLLAAVYTLILTTIIYAHRIKPEYMELSDFITIAFSAFTFAFGLIVNLTNFERKSNQQHECARKIRRLLNELKDNEKSVSDILTKYDDTLDQYDNHSRIDYYLFCLQNRKNFSAEYKYRLPSNLILFVYLPIAHYLKFTILFLTVSIVPITFILWVIKLT